jgi:nucleoside-diphosphate-sugar epimerase
MSLVIVTGAAGFIGSHLVELLVARGQRVVGIDRRAGMPAGTTEHLVTDLLDPDPDGRVRDALRAADAVFHLAGRPGVRDHGPALPWLRQRDNVLAGERVLRAVPPGVPVVVASSSSVYGGAPCRHGGRLRASRETDLLRPRGGYAASKAELERRCWQRAAAGGLVAVARPFTVAGERQRPDMAVAGWLAAVRQGRPIRILGDPARTRDLTDVRDVVLGLLLLAERGVGDAVNLGTGTGHRLLDIARAVADALGERPELVVEPAGPEEPAATLADTTRCRRLLGFTPRTDLPTLVRRQAAAPTTPNGHPRQTQPRALQAYLAARDSFGSPGPTHAGRQLGVVTT